MTDVRSRMCMSCLRVGRCAPDCADREPPLSATRVMPAVKVPEMPAGRVYGARRVPAWSAVCIASGAVLMAIGWIFNEPVARLIWEAIPR